MYATRVNILAETDRKMENYLFEYKRSDLGAGSEAGPTCSLSFANRTTRVIVVNRRSIYSYSNVKIFHRIFFL